jgi:hypothetical protein
MSSSIVILRTHHPDELRGLGIRGAGPDRLKDFISLGLFSLTDAANGPTPIPNAAEAILATSPALSQNQNQPSQCARGPGHRNRRAWIALGTPCRSGCSA